MPSQASLPMTLRFTYSEPDVISAHRLRMRGNPRTRMLLMFGVAAFAGTAAPRLIPGFFGIQAGLDWFLPLAVAAVFLVAPLLAYLVVPGLDYRRSPIWRPEYTLRVDQAGLKLSWPGAAGDFELKWRDVRKALANEQSFVLLFGARQDSLVVPRRIFAGPEQENLFLVALRSR